MIPATEPTTPMMSERPSTSQRPAAGRHPLLVGEVAQAHDGSLGGAHALIDAIADAGAGAVKFQTHLAHAESTLAEPWRTPFSPQDASRYEYWERMEFTEAQWQGLVDHARSRELAVISSPFSPEAVDLLERVGVDVWKVASGEVTNLPLLERLAGDGREILLSSGMSTWSELDQAVTACRAGGAPVTVLQCNTAYPCPPEKIGLNVLGDLAARYGSPVGLSDHSGTIYPGLAAVTLGASVVEVHVTLSRKAFGPDVAASVTDTELAQLAEGIAFLHSALTSPVDKDHEAAGLGELRTVFGRSVVARRALPAGHVLEAGDLAAKKPGGGIPASQIGRFVGHRLRRPLAADEQLRSADVEPEPTVASR
jgi:N,N'-diacetyllegionaminate synthase